MALSITSSNYNPAVNQAYTITVSPPAGGYFHHHVTLYESADGGATWTAIQTWQTLGTSTPQTINITKTAAGSFKYYAVDCYIDGTIVDQSPQITVTVGGTATSLSLTANPTQCIHDPPSEGVVTLTATLTSGGTALSGKTITFKVYDSTKTTQYFSTTATTDTYGKATVQITPSLWGAKYNTQIRAYFDGDATYAPATSDWVAVKWYGTSSTLTLTAPSSVNAGVQFQLQAVLKTSAGAAIPSASIRLLRGGTEVATATPDNQGVAYFYQTLQQGSYTFQAIYDGAPGSFAPSQSSQITVTVSGTGTLSLTATPGSAQITYNWSKYEGANFNHYRLKVGTSSGGSNIANLTFTDVNQTSYILTGLTNGVTYYATIYAEDVNNAILAQSQEVTATPQATTYTEVSPTVSSQKISLIRAVSGAVISSTDWNNNEQTIENFTGKVYVGSVSIPANIKDVKVNLPSGLPTSYKIIGTLESKIPCAFSLEELTSSYFLLHLAFALPYSSTFHFILWGLT